MDCPITAKYQPALTCFSAPNQHRILQYLAALAARQYTSLTLNAVVRALPHLRVLKHINHDSQDQHSLPVRWCCETITPIFRRAPCWSRAMIPAVLSSYKRYPW